MNCYSDGTICQCGSEKSGNYLSKTLYLRDVRLGGSCYFISPTSESEVCVCVICDIYVIYAHSTFKQGFGALCCRPDLFYDCALTPLDCKHTSYDVECNRYRYCEPNLCLIEDAATSELRRAERKRERDKTKAFVVILVGCIWEMVLYHKTSRYFLFHSAIQDAMICNDAPSMHPCHFRKVQCDPRHQCEARTAKFFRQCRKWMVFDLGSLHLFVRSLSISCDILVMIDLKI